MSIPSPPRVLLGTRVCVRPTTDEHGGRETAHYTAVDDRRYTLWHPATVDVDLLGVVTGTDGYSVQVEFIRPGRATWAVVSVPVYMVRKMTPEETLEFAALEATSAGCS